MTHRPNTVKERGQLVIPVDRLMGRQPSCDPRILLENAGTGTLLVLESGPAIRREGRLALRRVGEPLLKILVHNKKRELEPSWCWKMGQLSAAKVG